MTIEPEATAAITAGLRAKRLVTSVLAALVLTMLAAACANTPPNPAGAPGAIGFLDNAETDAGEDSPPGTLPSDWSPFPTADGDPDADPDADPDSGGGPVFELELPVDESGDLESSAPAP